ncbi:MAG: hypothetical protein ACREN2_03105 [Candidatus Dormibacteria bacterium]
MNGCSRSEWTTAHPHKLHFVLSRCGCIRSAAEIPEYVFRLCVPGRRGFHDQLVIAVIELALFYNRISAEMAS